MTLGYSCDAEECNEMHDAAFATMTLNLDSLPLQPRLALALNLHQEDLIDLDDSTYFLIMETLRNGEPLDLELPTAELHFCPDHTFEALSAIGTVNLSDEEEAEVVAEEQQT